MRQQRISCFCSKHLAESAFGIQEKTQKIPAA